MPIVRRRLSEAERGRLVAGGAAPLCDMVLRRTGLCRVLEPGLSGAPACPAPVGGTGLGGTPAPSGLLASSPG